MFLLAKFAAGVAGKMAVKAYFLAKMAGLKAFLVKAIGAQAAGISVSALAAGATVIYWERHVKRNSDSTAIDAAVAKGMSRDVAKKIVEWLAHHA
jgi:hypothetical protein